MLKKALTILQSCRFHPRLLPSTSRVPLTIPVCQRLPSLSFSLLRGGVLRAPEDQGFQGDHPSEGDQKVLSTMGESNGDEEMVIRVRGLPWSATKTDIIRFFEGIPIRGEAEGVHMTLSREGRPSGEAYIELDDQEDMENAEKKHNQHIGRRYIEVFQAKRSEMEWVIKRASMGPGHEDDCCVRLRGLPFGCSKEEIMQFFSGLEIVPNGIALPTDYQGRHTGEAYVQFLNKETAQKAMEKHKEKIAHRYIEIFKSNLNEIRAAMSPKMRGPGPIGGFNRHAPYDSRDRFGGPNRYNMGRGRGRSFNQGYNDYEDSWGGEGGGGGGDDNFSDNWGGRGGRMGGGGGGGGGGMPMKGNFGGRGGSNSSGTGHCVHMRGLPFRASEYDVAEFFRPLNPVNIMIQTDSSNRPSGEADVEFATHDDAVKAMNKDKVNMQHRYIELFLNSTPSSGGGGGGVGGGGMGGMGNMGGGPMGGGPMGGPMGGGQGGGNFGGLGSGNFGGANMGGGFSGGYGNMSRMGGDGRGCDDFEDRGPSDTQGDMNNGGARTGGYDDSHPSGGGPSQMAGNNFNSFC